MADSILPQPEIRAPMDFVQGGGGSNDGSSVISDATEVRAAIDSSNAVTAVTALPDISNAQLKVLTNGLTVRYVTPDIKDDIMNLKFIKGEQKLFDNHLRFNNPFIRRHIGADSAFAAVPVNESDNAVLQGNSIDAVESWVKASASSGTNDVTTVVGPIKNTLGGAPFEGERMYSSPNNFDCLIHALLNATSPTFRTLTVLQKNPIATKFRTTIMYGIYEKLIQNEQNPAIQKRLERNQEDLRVPWRDLDVDVAEKFGNAYNVTVLLFDSVGSVKQWTTLADNPKNSIILMYNPTVNHYEAIRSLGKYVFPYNAEWTKVKYAVTNIRECEFQEKDIVTKDGKSYRVLRTDINEGRCQYIYVIEVGTDYDIQELNDALLIKENATSTATDEYSTLKRDAAKKLISDGKKTLDETKYINILPNAHQYILASSAPASASSDSDSASADSATSTSADSANSASSTSNSATPPSSTSDSASTSATPPSSVKPTDDRLVAPKTPKEKFYDFWEIYINEDGTDGFHRMTGRKANAMKAYLDEIGRAYEDYLLKGALRYLQKKENPSLFHLITEKPKENILDMFFDVIEVPLDKVDVKPEVKPEVKAVEDEFTKSLQNMKIKESTVKGHFTAIETAYTACMNIIDSDAKKQFSELSNYAESINKEKNEIVKILISIEATIGESKKIIVELERKLLDKPDEVVSKELESTKKFIEESNKYIDSVRRYRNAAVLPENIIRAFQAIKPGVRGGILAKRHLFGELKEQYEYAVRLISDPSLKAKKVVVEEDEDDEDDEDYVDEGDEDDDNSVSVTSDASEKQSTVNDKSSLPTVMPRPQKPLTAAQKKAADLARGLEMLGAAGRVTRSGRQVKQAAPGGRGPKRKTRKALSKLSH